MDKIKMKITLGLIIIAIMLYGLAQINFTATLSIASILGFIASLYILKNSNDSEEVYKYGLQLCVMTSFILIILILGLLG